MKEQWDETKERWDQIVPGSLFPFPVFLAVHFRFTSPVSAPSQTLRVTRTSQACHTS